MKIIRVVILFLFVLTIVELLGYYMISDKLILGEVLVNHKPVNMAGIDNINVYSNYLPSEEQKQSYVNRYKESDLPLKRISFFSSADSFEQQLDIQNNFNYVVDIAFNKMPFAIVEEGENTFGNTAIFQSKYIWCLYTWILVKKEYGKDPVLQDQVLESMIF